MDKNRWTKEGLPIVGERIIEVMLRDFGKRGGEGKKSVKRWIDELINGIKIENRGYYEGMLKITDDYRGTNCSDCSDEEARAVIVGFLYGYELLRRSGETNKLEDSIK